MRPPLVICETRHGFICASAGVDASNTPEAGNARAAAASTPTPRRRRCATQLRERSGRDVGVIVTDSFGRPWRQGTTDVAIGAAGVEVMRELLGERDPVGYELKATVIAVADEIAGAAQLVVGQARPRPGDRSCAASTSAATGSATDIPIPPELDLFG